MYSWILCRRNERKRIKRESNLKRKITETQGDEYNGDKELNKDQFKKINLEVQIKKVAQKEDQIKQIDSEELFQSIDKSKEKFEAKSSM